VLCCFLESKFSRTMVCCVVAFCFTTTFYFLLGYLQMLSFPKLLTPCTLVYWWCGGIICFWMLCWQQNRDHIRLLSRCIYALHFSHVPEEATSAPSIQKPCIIQLLMNPNGVDDVRFHLAYQSSKAMFFLFFNLLLEAMWQASSLGRFCLTNDIISRNSQNNFYM